VLANKLARSGSAQRFVGPEPFLGFSRQNVRRNLNRWMEMQHVALWRGTCNTQRQAGELIPRRIGLQEPGYFPLIGLKPRLLLAY